MTNMDILHFVGGQIKIFQDVGVQSWQIQDMEIVERQIQSPESWQRWPDAWVNGGQQVVAEVQHQQFGEVGEQSSIHQL